MKHVIKSVLFGMALFAIAACSSALTSDQSDLTADSASRAVAGAVLTPSFSKSAWNGGYTGTFVIKNTGTAAATNWGMTFTLPAGTTITSSWSGTFTLSAGKWTVKPLDYNAKIAVGASVSFGFNASGSGVPANVTVSGGGGNPTIPSVPTGVAAAAGNASVKLSWAASDQATSYNLYWSKTAGVTKANGTKIAGVSSGYTQSGLTNGTTYYYVVTAVNSVGESAASAQVSAKPVAGASNPYVLYGYTTQGTGTTKTETSWDNFQYNTNYQILNNTWGVGINGDGKCTIFTETVNGTASFGWAYNVTNGNSVVVYPSVGYGWSPNSGKSWGGNPIKPKLSDNKTITSDFAIKSQHSADGTWNIAYDLWIAPSATPATTQDTYELMIWLDSNKQYPAGSFTNETLTTGGHSYKIAYAGDMGGGKWKCITYINTGAPIYNATGFDLTPIIKDATTRFKIPTSYYVAAIEFGNEVIVGSGMTEFTKWAVNIK